MKTHTCIYLYTHKYRHYITAVLLKPSVYLCELHFLLLVIIITHPLLVNYRK